MEIASRPPKALIGLLRRFDPAVCDLTVKLRSVVLREMAPCREFIYDAGYTVALWYGLTERVMDGSCLIAVYTKHVNLAFPRGSTLPDPHGLLQGSGKSMRHIQMKTPVDIARPEIRDYIRFAMAETKDDPVPGEKRPRLRGVVTTVKGRSSKKRQSRAHSSN